METERNLTLVSTVQLTKENYKNNSMIIKVKDEKHQVQAKNWCEVGKEMRIYLSQKTIPLIGNCTACESYRGDCREDIEREIIEIEER